ncbi:hypothetical protein ACLB9X_03785 [Streptomyces sp. 5K101]|uniref:hypothetical protein n=1 Tax=Streptomyces sp. 5K101 TaxID=3390037 RepID=UPI0039756D6E
MATLASLLTRASAPGRPLQDTGRQIVSELAPRPLSDDVTLLLARTRVIARDDCATWRLEADPAVVADART